MTDFHILYFYPCTLPACDWSYVESIDQKRDKECRIEVVRLLSRRQIRQIRSTQRRTNYPRRIPEEDDDERIDLDVLNEMIEVQEQRRRRERQQRLVRHQRLVRPQGQVRHQGLLKLQVLAPYTHNVEAN